MSQRMPDYESLRAAQARAQEGHVQPRKFDADYWALQDQMDADEIEAHVKAWDAA